MFLRCSWTKPPGSLFLLTGEVPTASGHSTKDTSLCPGRRSDSLADRPHDSPDHAPARRRHVFDRAGYRAAHVEPGKVREVKRLQERVIAPSGAHDEQATVRRHGSKPLRRKDLDMTAMPHFGRPPRAATHEAVEGARLALQRKHDVESATRFQDAGHLSQHALR